MSIKVITTVGLSLFENYFDDHPKTFKSDYKQLENTKYDQWGNENTQELIESLRKTVLCWLKKQGKDSGEIKSILKIQEEKKDDLDVYLIASHSILSRLAAEIIQEKLNGYKNAEGKTITVHFNDNKAINPDDNKDVIKGLTVANSDLFQSQGLINLVQRLEAIAEGSYKDNKYEKVVMNITGGFKGTIPYLVFWSQIFQVPIFYIFEKRDELIEIPYFPVEIDYQLYMDYWYALDNLYGRSTTYSVSEFKEMLSEPQEDYNQLIAKKIIDADSENIAKTVIGSILYNKFKNMLNLNEFDYLKTISNLVELKIYKYYVNKKYFDDPNKKIYQGKKFKGNDNKTVGDADILIDLTYTDTKKFILIEVKPGDNVAFDKIEEQINKFFKFIESNEKSPYKDYKQKEFRVYLYSARDLHPSVYNQIKDKMEVYPHIQWRHIKLEPKYKKSPNWELTKDKMTTITSQLIQEKIGNIK